MALQHRFRVLVNYAQSRGGHGGHTSAVGLLQGLQGADYWHRFRVLVSYAQIRMGPALAPACALIGAGECSGIAAGWISTGDA